MVPAEPGHRRTVPPRMVSSRPLRFLTLMGAWLFLSATAALASGSFSASLSDAKRTAAGLAALDAGQLAALDRLVADDLASAQRLQAGSLTGRFSLRRTEEQRRQAGLHLLNTAELAQLDELVAFAIASQPLPPRERPRLQDNQVVSLARRLEVHGGASFTLGWARGGGNFREASAWVEYFDPKTGISLGLGFSHFKGDGWYDPYSYDPYAPSWNHPAAYENPLLHRPLFSASDRPGRRGIFTATPSGMLPYSRTPSLAADRL